MITYDIEDLKKINKRNGRYFFSPDTMHGFNSRVSGVAYANDESPYIAYFVTSERDIDMVAFGRTVVLGRRLYTVRKMSMLTGRIDDASRFMEYASLGGAVARAMRLAETEKSLSVCQFCLQDMQVSTGCDENNLKRYSDGTVLPSSTEHFDEDDGKCHDCNAVHGNYHHPGCDVERCPRCGGQYISCDCS